NQLTQAFVENAHINGGALHLHAHSDNTVLGVAASGSGSKDSSSVAGGVTLSIFHQKTYAFVGDDATVNATDLSVQADNKNHVLPISGALDVSVDGSFSVGANVALLFADADVRSWIGAPDDVFDPTNDDTIDDDSVTHLGYAHGLATGEAVVYHNGGGASVGGLVDGQTYYVIVVDDSSISLAETREDALNFHAI